MRRLWSPSTVRRYRDMAEKMLEWVRKTGNEWKTVYENIRDYITALAEVKSGNQVHFVGCLLAALFSKKLSESDRSELKVHTKIPRQRANKLHAPVLKAASALRLRDLLLIIRRAQTCKLTRNERQAIDVMIVAFCTLSRAFEVAVLTVDHVAENGSYVVVRPKTAAQQREQYKKCVLDMGGVRPASILTGRREEAIIRGRKHLLSWTKDGDSPPETHQITSALKTALRKLGIRKRITAHSARKGAAVELLLNGAPIAVIRAWGIWAQLESLEAYLGRTIREEVSVLRFMPWAALN